MNAGWIALACLAVVGCRPMDPGGIAEARADEPAARGPGVAVVELFTSEGCSSCPPADTVLGELANPDGGVYALAFHVDYWDDLGWRDPFASPEFTDRQKAYARSLGGHGLYTPQMIVNGTEQFTGSDRARANQSIARARARPATVSLSVVARATASGAVVIDCKAQNAPADAVVDIAVVEHATSSVARAGENGGRVLHHANVVREFSVAPIGTGAASVVVQVPASLRRGGGEVIAYVQLQDGSRGMPVLGSARTELPR
ncbi:MAG: DUF1223 domain-containing protein [Polyangiaceae bacterium]